MGRIVVGVDGSDHSRAALRWAVDEGRRRNDSVEAVLVYEEPYQGSIPIAVDYELLEKSARTELDRIVDGVDAEGLPGPVERILCRGRAARMLLDAAKGADLLVVGSRGHGGFVGLLVGSVSRQVADHAPCPVVIVPGVREEVEV